MSGLAGSRSLGADGAAQPRIGFVGLWHGRDSVAWSGVPTRIMDGLEELDLFGGYYDVTPSPRLLQVLRSTTAGKDRGMWSFDWAPRTLLAVTNSYRRVSLSGRCDAWVVPAMGYGRPVRGRVASLCEITPAQLAETDLEVVRTMWPRITDQQLRAFGRQQLRLHRAATTCCVASTWAADSLIADRAIEASKVKVVGYGANLEVEPPTDRSWETPRFLFVGNGWSRKNGDRVVRAFARIHTAVPAATLDVVGDHPRLDVPGVTGHGRRMIHDPAGRELLTKLYRSSTCFVLPSRLESFGIVYVEAARAGLPAIGTTRGGTRTSIGEGGLLVDPLDEEAIYRAMRRLCNPAEAQRLGAAARSRSRHFTWRRVTERIAEALSLRNGDGGSLTLPR